jgi:hypothetical protein
MGALFYILNEHDEPVPVQNAIEWAEWFDAHDDRRSVLQDHIGNARVSTVFLGLDHAMPGAPPLLYETMVFGGDLSGEEARYQTRDEAVAGHAAMCERVRQAGG